MTNVCASFTFILIKQTNKNLRKSGSTCSSGNTFVLCVYPSCTAHTLPHDILWDDGSVVVCLRCVPKQHLTVQTSQQQPHWPLQGPDGSAGTLAAVRILQAQPGVQSGVLVVLLMVPREITRWGLVKVSWWRWAIGASLSVLWKVMKVFWKSLLDVINLWYKSLIKPESNVSWWKTDARK